MIACMTSSATIWGRRSELTLKTNPVTTLAQILEGKMLTPMINGHNTLPLMQMLMTMTTWKAKHKTSSFTSKATKSCSTKINNTTLTLRKSMDLVFAS